MKKLLLAIIFFATALPAMGQRYVGYERWGKYTDAQMNAINTSNPDEVYKVYNTTQGKWKCNDGGAGWVDCFTGSGSSTDDQIFTDFSLSGNTLSITIENGNTVNVDLSTIVGNVSITDFSLSGNNLTLELSNGSTDTVDLSSLIVSETDDQTLAEVLAEGSDAGGSKITNLGAPTLDNDAARKVDVDSKVNIDPTTPRNALVWGPGTKAEFYEDYPYPSTGFPSNGIAFIIDSIAPIPEYALPIGGTSGQMLAKVDGTDYNVQWVNAPSSGSFDTTTDKILDTDSNSSPFFGQDWIFSGNDYNSRWQGINGLYNLNLNFNGVTRTYSFSTGSFRAGTTNTVDLGTNSFRFKDGYFAGVLNAGTGSSNDWNANTTNYRKELTTATLTAIPEASISDGDVATVVLNTHIYVFDSGATSGTADDLQPDDDADGIGWWINKTASSGIDTNANFYLSSLTATAWQLGTSWIWGGNNYSAYLSGSNGLTYFNWNHNGTINNLQFGTLNIRPGSDNALDWGTATNRWNDGYFGGILYAGSVNLGGSGGFVLDNGTVDTNSYLPSPSASELNVNFTASETHLNSFVNYTGGATVSYTINSGLGQAGDQIFINNEGATTVNITAGTATVNTNSGGSAALSAGQAAKIIQVQTDEWLIINLN